MDKLSTKKIISFEVDLNTANEFQSLIYNLESQGVYMDFIFNISPKFTDENNTLIHVERLPKPITWNEVSIKKYHYFESKVVTVNLEHNPNIYFIFSALYLNKFTNLIYDFYEGSDAVYVSFFANNTKEEKSIEIEPTHTCDLSEDNFNLDEVDISEFTQI